MIEFLCRRLACSTSSGAVVRPTLAWSLRRFGATCVVGLLVATGGCAPLSLLCAPRLGRCSWIDLEPARLEAVGQLQLRARVVGKGVDYRFPVVVEADSQALVLVGLTPLGTKAFSVRRDSQGTHRESALGPALPLDPRSVAADVSALLVSSACGGAAGVARENWVVEDGVTERDLDRWHIEDLCRDGRLVERRIGGPGAVPAVVVHYDADEARVEHARCGYEATYVVVAGALPGFAPRMPASAEAAGSGAAMPTSPPDPWP